ncbi:Phytanoyl-CoA dioxygenase family protein [Sulfidibacter corallicola]|uniref:Phytanoyl-CoA dioxygenase family protein n=1 Tax=Sulfidibacter corallicola TaxID=2818388 RepID=A0A8A4TJF5_SULCO|nr:phytanoyl-CoA dioxygenase family protein [Sulfidibacter corallicola]QTD49723.1 phytanoyl-CoA dioxygenase family protein [Sulfidibacter corallicola]
MNVHTLAERLWCDGYLHLENFFDLDLMDRLHDLILAHYGPDPEHFHNQEFLSRAATEVIPWFPQRTNVAAFEEVAEHPSLCALTDAILGSGWHSQECMVMFSKPGSKGQAWHQDCPPDIPERFNLNRLIYTEDVDPDNGGQVVVVPGSHRRGLLPVGAPHGDLPTQVTLQPAKGSLVLLHGHAYHRVLPVGDRCRVSTNYRCVPQGTPLDITDICVYRTMRYQFSTNRIVQERAS